MYFIIFVRGDSSHLISKKDTLYLGQIGFQIMFCEYKGDPSGTYYVWGCECAILRFRASGGRIFLCVYKTVIYNVDYLPCF